VAIRLLKKRYLAYVYSKVFNLDDPDVKVVIRDLCLAHNVFDGGFDPDPYLNAFNSGERNVILRILTILKLTPEEIANLAEEEE